MRTTLNAVRLTTCVTALLLAVCASETLFRRTFDSTPNGQPPATAQSVGTAQVVGVSGGVTVIAPPVTPSGKWIQIGRLDPQGDVAGMQGRMTKSGEGVYTFSATMFMPAGAGVATVQFEQSSNGPSDLGSFLHLDFMPDNTVRIDDNDATKFGSFQRNQPFIVQVTLRIGATASTAHIALSGAFASGEKDTTIEGGPLQFQSRPFGAIRIWQGSPHTGAFDTTNIAVTRQTQ